jgi:very-short-patch-repair endonuclease
MKPRNSLRSFARELRNSSTDAERLLWRYLRNRQVAGVKFRRQQPIETYIVDFVSFDKKIVIELDGGQHADNGEHDKHRDAYLHANGFVVVRFWNNEIIENIEGVLEVIRQQCLRVPSPAP